MSENEIMLGKDGYIVNYKQSRHIIHPKHVVLKFPTITTRHDAGVHLLGHTVAWISTSGKSLKGKITKLHGNNGSVMAHFKKAGLPGQALSGHTVKIVK